MALAAGGAWGAELHVAPDGDDGAAGSADAPWASLQRAADAVRAGDTVLVADGQYEGFALATSGTESSPIVFRATGAGAVIDAAGPEEETGIYLCATSWVVVEGLHVTGVAGRGIAHRCATADERAGRSGSRKTAVAWWCSTTCS